MNCSSLQFWFRNSFHNSLVRNFKAKRFLTDRNDEIINIAFYPMGKVI